MNSCFEFHILCGRATRMRRCCMDSCSSNRTNWTNGIVTCNDVNKIIITINDVHQFSIVIFLSFDRKRKRTKAMKKITTQFDWIIIQHSMSNNYLAEHQKKKMPQRTVARSDNKVTATTARVFGFDIVLTFEIYLFDFRWNPKDDKTECEFGLVL